MKTKILLLTILCGVFLSQASRAGTNNDGGSDSVRRLSDMQWSQLDKEIEHGKTTMTSCLTDADCPPGERCYEQDHPGGGICYGGKGPIGAFEISPTVP